MEPVAQVGVDCISFLTIMGEVADYSKEGFKLEEREAEVDVSRRWFAGRASVITR